MQTTRKYTNYFNFSKFNILNQSKMLEQENLYRCTTLSYEHAINNCIYHGNKEHIFSWKLQTLVYVEFNLGKL